MQIRKIAHTGRCYWVPQPSNAVNVASESYRSSQMPRHLISDAHECINKIITVSVYYRVNDGSNYDSLLEAGTKFISLAEKCKKLLL